nr:uncharacterized protein LOC113817239 [Penaeus vannamei]
MRERQSPVKKLKPPPLENQRRNVCSVQTAATMPKGSEIPKSNNPLKQNAKSGATHTSSSPQKQQSASKKTQKTDNPSVVMPMRGDSPETSDITYARFQNNDSSPSRRKFSAMLKGTTKKTPVANDAKVKTLPLTSQKENKKTIQPRSTKPFSNFREKLKKSSSTSKETSSSKKGDALSRNTGGQNAIGKTEIKKGTKSESDGSSTKSKGKKDQRLDVEKSKLTSKKEKSPTVSHKNNKTDKSSDKTDSKKVRDTGILQTETKLEKSDSFNVTMAEYGLKREAGFSSSSALGEAVRADATKPLADETNNSVWEEQSQSQTLPKDFVMSSSWAKFEDFDWDKCQGTVSQSISEGDIYECFDVTLKTSKEGNDITVADNEGSGVSESRKLDQEVIDSTRNTDIKEDTGRDKMTIEESTTKEKIDDKEEDDKGCENANIEQAKSQSNDGNQESEAAKVVLSVKNSERKSSLDVPSLPPRKLKEVMMNWVSFEDSQESQTVRREKVEKENNNEMDQNAKLDPEKAYENVWFSSGPCETPTPFDDECDEEFKVYASVKPFGDDTNESSSFEMEGDPFAKIIEELVKDDTLGSEEKEQSSAPTILSEKRDLIVCGPAEEVMQKPMRFDRIFKLDIAPPATHKPKGCTIECNCSFIASSTMHWELESNGVIPVMKHDFEYALCRFEIDYKGFAKVDERCRVFMFSTPLELQVEEFKLEFVNEIPVLEHPYTSSNMLVEPASEVFEAVEMSAPVWIDLEVPSLIHSHAVLLDVEAELYQKYSVSEIEVSLSEMVNSTIMAGEKSNVTDKEMDVDENNSPVEELTGRDFSDIAACPHDVQILSSAEDENRVDYSPLHEEKEFNIVSSDETDLETEFVTYSKDKKINNIQPVDLITVEAIDFEDDKVKIESHFKNIDHNMVKNVNVGDVLSCQLGDKQDKDMYPEENRSNCNISQKGVINKKDLDLLHALESVEEVELEAVTQELSLESETNVTFVEPGNISTFVEPRKINFGGIDTFKIEEVRVEDDKIFEQDMEFVVSDGDVPSALKIPQILIHAPSDETLSQDEGKDVTNEEEFSANQNYLKTNDDDDDDDYTSDMEDIPVCSLAEEEMLRALMHASAEEATQEFIDVFVVFKNQYQLPERVQAKMKKVEKEPFVHAFVEEEMTFLSLQYLEVEDNSEQSGTIPEKHMSTSYSDVSLIRVAAEEVYSVTHEFVNDLQAYELPKMVQSTETFEPEKLMIAEEDTLDAIEVTSDIIDISIPVVPKLQEMEYRSSSEDKLIHKCDNIQKDVDNVNAEKHVSSVEKEEIQEFACEPNMYMISSKEALLMSTKESSTFSLSEDVRISPVNFNMSQVKGNTNISGRLSGNQSMSTSVSSQAESVEGEGARDIVSVNNAAVLQYWAGVMKEKKRNICTFGMITDFELPEESGLKGSTSIPIPQGGCHMQVEKELKELSRKGNDLDESKIYFLSCSPDSAFDGIDFQLPVEEEEGDWLEDLEDFKGEEAFDSEFEFGEMELESDSENSTVNKLSPEMKSKHGKRRLEASTLISEAAVLKMSPEKEVGLLENQFPKEGGWFMDGIRHTTKGLYNLFFYGQTPGDKNAEENPMTQVDVGKDVTGEVSRHSESQELTHRTQGLRKMDSQETKGANIQNLCSTTRHDNWNMTDTGTRPKSHMASQDVSVLGPKISECYSHISDDSIEHSASSHDAVSRVDNKYENINADLSSDTSEEEQNFKFLAQLAGVSPKEESNRAALRLLLTKVLQVQLLLCVLQSDECYAFYCKTYRFVDSSHI